MWNDSVVAEVRAARQAYAARFGFDLEAIVRDLQELERTGGRVVLQPPPGVRSPTPLPLPGEVAAGESSRVA